MLNVNKIIAPNDWFNCILWSRYKHHGCEASLELFINRPKDSEFYYSVGEDGSMLMPRDTRLSVLTINPETVRTLAGQSVTMCPKPVLQVWEDKQSPETTAAEP
ncbi:hypothetical protein JTE90_016320 [Oedothorax gibbosus]|uniref:Uncharacterized protein n=1 Tax=Oedothorax gibbosus TaxID=931172 RepID=A0AAV6TQE6_9ARAC|nr:hypothetical protein JTE90_016320 [Oedothorax gibbosus]